MALADRHLAGLDRALERPARGVDIARAVVVADDDRCAPDALQLVVPQHDPVVGVADRDTERQLGDHGLQLRERVLCPSVETDEVERERDSPRELRDELEVLVPVPPGLGRGDCENAKPSAAGVEEGCDARVHVGMGDADELGLATRDVDVAAVGDPGDDELRHPPEQLLVVERLRQLLRRLEEEREPGARALGLAPGGDFLRDVARDVDDELDAAVRREHGRGAQREPALPAARARTDADDGRALRAVQRLRGRLVFGRDSSAVGVEDLVQRRALLGRERGELVGRVEACGARSGVVREQQAALAVRRGDPFLDRAQDARELPARLVQRLLRLRPLGHRSEVVRDRPREEHLAVAPVVRRVAVEHELPEQPATAHERDEGERPDSLLAHHALERRLELRAGEIVDEHGLWVPDVRRPRRVPLGEGAVAIGEPAPGTEAEHALVVGEQDRGAIRARGFEERVERRL